MTDASLITAHQCGDLTAFGKLIERHQAALMGFLRRRVGEDAEELHQELWARVSRNLDSYTDDGRFRAFLFTAARRLVIDHHRRRSVRPELVGVEEIRAAVRPRDTAAARELVDAVESALSEMSAETAEVVRMRLAGGVPFAEIAAHQGAPLNTVLSRMHRGLKTLRVALIQQGLAGDRRGIR